MNFLARLGIVGTVGVLLVACEPREQSVQLAANMPAADAPAAPATPGVLPAVDELRRQFDKDEYNTMTGELVDGRLVNNGKVGFLLYGPYVAFHAGTYSVSFVGNIDELPVEQKVQVDVVSNKGKTTHAMTELDEVGSIPPFEFTLTEPARDLEVRVLAPKGAKVTLQAYQVERLR